MDKFSTIRSLISATFNQDWASCFDDWEACLADELRRGSPEWKSNLVEEIRGMVDAMDEDGIGAFFEACKAGIYPPHDMGLSCCTWLLQVAELTSLSLDA